MRQILENIVNSTKAVIKNIRKSCRQHYKSLIMLGFSFYWAANIPKANGESYIEALNIYTFDDWDYTAMVTGEDYHEKFVFGFPDLDTEYVAGMGGKLTIWTKQADSPELKVNAKPSNTPGWDVYLGAKEFISGPKSNELYIYVTADELLQNREVLVYNADDPNERYSVDPNIGEITIPLPDLVNQQPEVYAHWRVETPARVSGDIADSNGVGYLDGTTDIYDLAASVEVWLETTSEPNNYSWGDLNYDRENNLEDFALQADGWRDYSPHTWSE